MIKKNTLKRTRKALISLLLVFAVMVSLLVPFDISVFADEESATGNDIYAILYYINAKKAPDTTNNLELVIQRGDTLEEGKTKYKIFSEFADSTDISKLWYSYNFDVMKVDIKDKIAPTRMNRWFLNMRSITSENILHLENIDTSNVLSFNLTFENMYALTELDVSSFDVSKATNFQETFCGCKVLTDLNVSTWTMSKANYMPSCFQGCTALEHLDLSGLDMTNAQYMTSMFRNCTSLKTIEFGSVQTVGSSQLCYLFLNCSSLEEVDMSGWVSKNVGTMLEMFNGCTSLKSVDFGSADNWGPTPKNWSYNGFYERAYEFMFNGCESLESLNLTCVKGALICGSMFKGCKNLKELNLGYAGLGQSNVEPNLSGKDNIFEGCKELSWIKLSADGWPANGLAGSSVPPKSTWRKIDSPNKNLKLTSDMLFQQFKSDYAGTWVADSFISFKGNGGSPNIQTVDGNKDVELVFDENEVVATRAGYDFAGWWTDKTGGTQLHSGDVAQQWSYYAHWNEHTYDLVLNGNGGTVPAGVTIDGATISQDRKTITFNNISYSEFIELNSKMFEKAGKSVLSSWNTRSNATGTQYFVSDSVNQLTPTQGGTVTLFAQWDEPDYVVTFDSQGGSSVSKKSYKQNNKYGSLPPSEKAGNTFIGWFTAAEGGTEIKSSMTVNGDITLYAHWEENPKIYFDPCNESGNVPFSVYDYGHKLGVVDTPEWGTRTFDGWYTAGECCYYTDGSMEGGKYKVTSWPQVSASPTVKDTITVKITDNQNWGPIYVYAFDKDENATMGDFPGTAMSYIGNNDYNEGIYSAEVPATSTKVVFSNGNGSQTVDVTLTPGRGGNKIDDISSRTATGNAYYYAHWGYKPTFESNGGTYDENGYNEENYEIQNDKDYEITHLPSATKPYHTLDGWYFQYEENGVQKEKKVNEGDTVDLSKGTIIRAKWTPTNSPVTVTCINKDPSDPENSEKTITTEIKVYRGNDIRQLPTPEREGYDFVGWFKENSDTPETVDSTFSADTELFARWTAKNVPISFNPNGGTLADSSQSTVNVSNGGSIDVLPNASLTNKMFAGWFLKADNGDFVETSRLVSGRVLPDTKNYGVTITDNKTYYAKWIDAETLEDNGFFKCEAKWKTESSVDGENMGDTLVFRPVSGGKITAHLSMAFERVQNKKYEMPVGSIKIKMPVSVFKDKNGNNIGTNNINGNNEYTRSSETIDREDYYVYTNTVPLTKDSGFEFHYDVEPTELAANSDGDLFFKNNFKVYIQYDDNNSNEPHHVDYVRDMGVEVHTQIDTRISKSQSAVSLVWDTTWGDKPADADEYFYVTWKLNAVISNCTQKYKLRWSEDTAHDGTIIYKSSNLDTWTSELATGGSTPATVVTKHRRSEVDSTGGWHTVRNEAILDIEMASGEKYHYRPSATATAYIPATESSSSSSSSGNPVVDVHDNNNNVISKFSKTIKEDYTKQNNHTMGYAQESILNDNASALSSFDYTITYNETTNTDSNISWSNSTNTYQTAERTMLLSDGNTGDLRISEVSGNNRYKWGDSSIEQNLNPSDYYFTSLKISLTEYDAIKMNDTWSNPFKHRKEDYGDIVVRVRTTTNTNLEVVPIEDADGFNDYVEVTLPEGTYYYEVEHKTSFYTTDLKVDASFKLNLSNRLKSIVSDHVVNDSKTLIKNKSKIDVKRGSETKSISSMKENDAWPAAYELTKGESTLYTFKRCASQANISHDESTSTETFSVLLTAWNYNTGTNMKYMKSGEFNDLLPPECTVDKDTVYVQRRTDNTTIADLNDDTELNNAIAVTPAGYESQKAENTVLPTGNYSVVLTPDWQGSGRTMLTVRITTPENKTATGYNVFYKMKTSYSNINRRGTHMMNSTSFTDTTNKQSKPNTKINTIDLLDSDTKEYYTSIDDDYTAFAKAQTDCIVPSIYTYGITSLVQAEGSKLTEHEVVGLNTPYFYNINYSNNSNTTDLVFFDTIEKRIDGEPSQWYGTFLGIDVSQIREVKTANGTDGYCNPVVYYTTKDKSQLSADDFDLNSSIWSRTPPSDISEVTAVAVDCRKTTKDLDFVLAKKQNLAFNLNMHAPGNNVNNNDITYNEAVVKGEIVDNDMKFNSYTYTDVTIKFSEPEFSKTAFPESGKSGAPAEVVGNSVLNYYLKIKNPDEIVPMNNVVVEDNFDRLFNFNNPIMVQIDDGEEIQIDGAARISSYTIEPVTVDNVSKLKFRAVIDSIDKGETITIRIPVTVPNSVGTVLTNKAKITSVNGVTYGRPVESEETFHKVTGTKAKILKTKTNGKALAGAQLQIFENNSTNFDSTTGKIKAGAKAIELRRNETVVGEGADHDYFTSTTEVLSFDIAPGNYVLHEKTLPTGYETLADDIPFRVDVEGIHYIKKNNKEESVSYIEMKNIPPYQVIYHTNLPTDTDEIFKTVDSPDLDEKKVPEFSDIPTFTGDKYYSFMGWYTQESGGEKVSFDRTYDETTHLYAHWHAYKVIFHENNPEIDDKDIVFKTFDPSKGELNVRNGITHFYDIPSWAGDEYVFAGWYHNTNYLKTTKDIDYASDFESDTYLKKDESISDPDYHLYAKWIKVGTVDRDQQNDANIISTYRGFGLAGVQIRDPKMMDSNYNNNQTPQGMRFVTSIKEQLLKDIDDVSTKQVTTDAGESVNVEYGYVVGTEQNINAFKTKYKFGNDYRLQYKGENVNGVNTLGNKQTTATDYRYISNINCTSNVKIQGTYSNGKGMVAEDHRNFTDYRLYTLVVTYESEASSSMKGNKLDARAYIRYYDANGKLRVFYNDYKNSGNETYYGGCMCSFNQVADMAIPQDQKLLEQQQQVND